MKNVFWVLSTFVFVLNSCHFSKKKECQPLRVETSKTVDTLKTYNSILNNLIDNHLYNKYLGRKWELLAIDLHKKKIDSITYLKKMNVLKNTIIKNDSLKGTLYVDEIFNGYESDVSFLKLHDEFDIDEIKNQISKKNHLSIDSLKSDLVKLRSLSNKDTLKLFEIGKLGLSKLLFSKDKSLGMLYFEFICGSKCGEGSIILIKKINDIWYIEKKYAIWEI